MLTLEKVKKEFASFLEKRVVVKGRIIATRKMKKTVFADIFSRGFTIQCCFDRSMAVPANGDLVEITGECFYTRTKEATIKVIEVETISRWQAEVSYKDVEKSNEGPLQAFLPETYKMIHCSQLVRNFMRKFLTENSYFEVQTPILGKKYNGGRSYPVVSSCLGKNMGFNRTTMEDRMQSFIVMGYDKIFEIGSVFRSNKEVTFLEGYETFLSWGKGKELIKEMIAYVTEKIVLSGAGEPNEITDDLSQKKWIEVDFFNGFEEIFQEKKSVILDVHNAQHFFSQKKSADGRFLSLESGADEIANKIAKELDVPVVVNGFPFWSSPLYAPVDENPSVIQRSKFYFPNQEGGFEIGVQENNYERFMERVLMQKKAWGFEHEEEGAINSPLSDIISGGVPPLFGFGINPDRIAKIWYSACTIDPYKEST